jgi:hypothetical protein
MPRHLFSDAHEWINSMVVIDRNTLARWGSGFNMATILPPAEFSRTARKSPDLLQINFETLS